MKKILFTIILFAFPPSMNAMEKCTKCYYDSKEYGFQKKINPTPEELHTVVDAATMQYEFEEVHNNEYPQGFNKRTAHELRKKLLALKVTNDAKKTFIEEAAVGHIQEKE